MAQQSDQSHPLRTKALLGGFALSVRKFLGQIVGLVANVVLARVLSPEDFGIFAIVHFVVFVFSSIGTGLINSLIRQPDEPDYEDEKTAFSVLVTLSLTSIVLIGVFSGAIVSAYHLDKSYKWLLIAFSLDSLLAAFRSVPNILLRRRMQFGAIAGVEFVEQVTYYICAVSLALWGLGVWSLVIGFLLSRAFAVLVLYSAIQWKIGWHLDKERLGRHLPFATKNQGAHFLGLIRNAINPTFIGQFCGVSVAGFVSFANARTDNVKWMTPILSTIAFPVFSAVQRDKVKFNKAIDASLRWNSLMYGGFASTILPLAYYAVSMIYGEKWTPTVPLFIMLILANATQSLLPTVAQIANALDKPGINLKYSLASTIVLWTLVVIFVPRFGFIGYGISFLILQVVTVAHILAIKELAKFHLWRNVFPTVIAFVLNAGLLHCGVVWLKEISYLELGLLLIFGFISFALMANFLSSNLPWQELRAALNPLKSDFSKTNK